MRKKYAASHRVYCPKRAHTALSTAVGCLSPNIATLDEVSYGETKKFATRVITHTNTLLISAYFITCTARFFDPTSNERLELMLASNVTSGNQQLSTKYRSLLTRQLVC